MRKAGLLDEEPAEQEPNRHELIQASESIQCPQRFRYRQPRMLWCRCGMRRELLADCEGEFD